MKEITSETKLSELIPEGFELSEEPVSEGGVLMPKNESDFQYKCIWFKKKQKDFDWYIKQFFTTGEYEEPCSKHMSDWLTLDDIADLETRFMDKNYASIPFEIKIGMLKYICDDVDVHWANMMSFLNNRYINKLKGLNSSSFERVSVLCPKEFLESIFV